MMAVTQSMETHEVVMDQQLLWRAGFNTNLFGAVIA